MEYDIANVVDPEFTIVARMRNNIRKPGISVFNRKLLQQEVRYEERISRVLAFNPALGSRYSGN